MRNAFIAVVILASIAAAPRRGAFDKPVRVAGGLVSGVSGRNPSVTVFKGVPFAAPPVGDLRWREPKPVVAWQGVRKADAFGSSCMQSIVDERKPWTYEFMTHTEVSEDCLFLNVWTAAKSPSEKRPVYVYIHGGGNTEGSGAVPVYDGEGLARKGIVVVTVNYRLGVLGFFTHPELTKESDAHASGNYALLDLIAALPLGPGEHRRIRRRPRERHGGRAVGRRSNTHSLTASPLAKGLFHRAIAESGSSVAAGAGTRTLAEQEQLGVKFAEAKGAHSLADLRALSWKDLSAPVTACGIRDRAAATFRFGVVVDGHVLPASVADVFASGKQNDVPTLTGANKHEGGATPHPEITAEAFQKQARQRFGELADEFLSLYPSATDEQARLVQNESSWDQARVSMYLWAMNRARDGENEGLHLLLGSCAARSGRRESTGPSTRRRCPTS